MVYMDFTYYLLVGSPGRWKRIWLGYGMRVEMTLARSRDRPSGIKWTKTSKGIYTEL